MALMLIIYIALGAGGAYLGRDRKLGGWAFFALSLLLAPLIGIIIVLVSEKKKPLGAS